MAFFALWTIYQRILLAFGAFDVMTLREIGTANKHAITAFFNGHIRTTLRAVTVFDNFEDRSLSVVQRLGVVAFRIATTAYNRAGFAVSDMQIFPAVRTLTVLMLQCMLVCTE